MMTWQKNLPPIRGEYKYNEPLKKYTWLNVGGPADVMFFPKDVADLQCFLQNKPVDLPVFILGSGSNILVRDGGVDGVVIKLDASEFTQWHIKDNMFVCGSGLKNSACKKIFPDNNLAGLEFICSIPGSIGGLVCSNAGCFGSELSDVLQKADIITGAGDIITVKPSDFKFSYRHSEFPKDWIILRLYLKTEYAPTSHIADKIAQNNAYRQAHQPHGVRTAGSTFKNPKGVRAWELIEKVGGRQMKNGGALFSPMHCNFMINDGTATAKDLEELGEKVRLLVKKQENVDLEWEIKIIGRKNGNS